MYPVGFTSRLTAAARARESERPDRFFNDEFAADRRSVRLACALWLAFDSAHYAEEGVRLGRPWPVMLLPETPRGALVTAERAGP